ncbi:MAG: Scr1 family TA system antitoxin-like transcriptional regulator [Pseudonocardiaceae bacterium]
MSRLASLTQADRRGTPSEHADQLTHLLSLTRLPFISVGVIPADAQRHAIATIGFGSSTTTPSP